MIPTKFFTSVIFSIDHRTIAFFICNRASEQREIYQGLDGTYVRAPRITLKISDFKQTNFLVVVDTGSDISLIHEMFIENKNLLKIR